MSLSPSVLPLDTSLPHLATTPISFRRVMAAIDFSRQTPAVLQTAIQVAHTFSAELFLLNAAIPTVYGTGTDPVRIESFDGTLSIAQARMEELVGAEPQLATLKHKQIVACAGPLELIRQATDEHDIDLVIAGSHGTGGMERLALGSVAERILRSVRCPTLVIGPQCRPQKDLLRSILLATRLTPAGLRSAQYASALAERAHSTLTLLHVVEPGKSNRALQPELLHDHLIEELTELLPADATGRITAQARVEYGKASDLIVSVALCSRSTLIVMGARDDRPLADHSPVSTVAHVIHGAVCPVLTVRGHFR